MLEIIESLLDLFEYNQKYLGKFIYFEKNRYQKIYLYMDMLKRLSANLR